MVAAPPCAECGSPSTVRHHVLARCRAAPPVQGEVVGVQLELLVPVGGPVTMPLNWAFTRIGSRRLVVLIGVSRNRDGTDGRVWSANSWLTWVRREQSPRLMAGLSLFLAGFAVMSQLVRRAHTIYSTFPWRGYPYLPPYGPPGNGNPAQLDTGRGFPQSGSTRPPAHPSVPNTPLAGHGLALDAGEEFPAFKMHVAVNLDPDHIPPRQCRRGRHLPGPGCPRPGT
jgi:hypothetical protein